MNNNEIKNQKVEVPSGMALNDKDYLNSLLSCLKEMVKNYASSLTEASNETLYTMYKEMFDEYCELQRAAYELMFKNGWYVIEKKEASMIMSKFDCLNNEFTSLNK